MNSNLSIDSSEIVGILNSLALAKQDIKFKLQSRHWDVFGQDFLTKLQDRDALYNFRRSGLSKWLDDSNVEHNEKKIISYYSSLIKIVGFDFFNSVAESTVGSPYTINVDGKPIDFNDLFLVYYASQIRSFVRDLHPIIVEIGGGYGGLGVKLKKLFPSATIICLDLPEVNAIQTHYIRRNFQDARLLSYEERRESSSRLSRSLLSSYDFAVLPGWIAEEFEDNSVDLIINTRSMMEMDIEIISFYFSHIQRILRTNGFFYCVNRYEKSTVGYPIRIKDYPYDDHWYVTISRPSWKQPAIHEFGCVRTMYPALNSARSLLNQLKPFSPIDILLHIKMALRTAGNMARDRIREMAIVQLFVKITGYQRFRQNSQF